MKIEDFKDLFEMSLRYAYDGEQKLVKEGIPGMIRASGSPELKRALEQHLRETGGHVTRLERIFSAIGSDPKTQDNNIIDEMTNAAEDMVSATEDGSLLRDAALIVAANQVEHYEMAVYGSLAAFARRLGLTEAAQLLHQTLNEEKRADAKLTQIGETWVNDQASEERRAA